MVSSVYLNITSVSYTISKILIHLEWMYVQVIVQSDSRYRRILSGINSHVTSEYEYICALNTQEMSASATEQQIEDALRSLNDERSIRGVLILMGTELLL